MNSKKVFKSYTEKLVLEIALITIFTLCVLIVSTIFGHALAAEFADAVVCEQAVIELGAKAMEAPLSGEIQTSVLSRLDLLLEACSTDLQNAGVEYDAIVTIVESAR